MSASWAKASHGYAVTHQRSSPAAERSRNRPISGWAAAERRASLAGSMPESSRVFQAPMMAMRASIASISSSVAGGRWSSWASLAAAR